jgi:hypothetical protein
LLQRLLAHCTLNEQVVPLGERQVASVTSQAEIPCLVHAAASQPAGPKAPRPQLHLRLMHRLPFAQPMVQSSQTGIAPQASGAVPGAQVPVDEPEGILQQPPLHGEPALQVSEQAGGFCVVLHAWPARQCWLVAQPQAA